MLFGTKDGGRQRAPSSGGSGKVRFLRRLLALFAFVMVASVPMTALAAVPTLYFTQGTNGIPVPSPAPYKPVKAIYTEVLTYHGRSLGPLQQVNDIYIDNTPQHNLWVVDTQGNRVIELAQNPNKHGVPQYNKVKLVIGWPKPTSKTSPYALKGPLGVAVGPHGIIYIADTGNGRVAAFTPNGVFLKDLNVTTSKSLQAQNFKFAPERVAVDARGTIYVVNAGTPYGLAEFNSNGQFLGFFAPNILSFTSTLKYQISKIFQTKAQKSQQASILPPEVNNVYVGPDGYIYTTSVDVSTRQIRRLNDVGTDTLNLPGTNVNYGLPINALPTYVFQNIMESHSSGPVSLTPLFVSIAASKTGIITALDQLTNYVFQFSRGGKLLYTFGGLDNGNGVLGLFEQPTAVAVAPKNEVLVSDAQESNITVFQPTRFGQLVQEASLLYSQGHYRQAQKPWSQVLAYDTNYDLAHAELGKGYLARGELLGSNPSVLPTELGYFAQALHQFYLANDKTDYGTAFSWYRHDWMRINFSWVFLAFLGFWLVVYLLIKVVAPRLRAHPVGFQGAWARNQFVRAFPMMWRVIKHPAEAFFQLKYEAQGTLYQGLLLIGLAYLMHLINLMVIAFDFSPLVKGQTNLLYTSSQFLLPLATWIVANYLVGDLYEGEANLSEVITGSAYALVPFILLQLPLAVASHSLVPTDHIYGVLVGVQLIWVGYLFFTQVRVLHNLEWVQAFKASMMTLVGIGVLWTMFVIVFGLGQQAVLFVHQIYQEIMLLRS